MTQACLAVTGVLCLQAHAASDTDELLEQIRTLRQDEQNSLNETARIRQLIRYKDEELQQLAIRIQELEVQLGARPGPPGDPATPVADASERPSREQELIKQAAEQLLFFKGGDDTTGVAFIASCRDQTRIFTSAQLLSGSNDFQFVGMDGKTRGFQPHMECPLGTELVSIKPAEQDLPHFEWVSGDEKLNTGDHVLILSANPEDSTIKGSSGKIRGIGPDVWELEAELDTGMTGAPVLSLASGRVVGIVTPFVAGVKSDWAQGTRHANARNFAARLDRIKGWETIDLDRFSREAAHLGKLEEENHFFWLAYQMMTSGRKRGDAEFRREFGNYHTHPIYKRVTRWANGECQDKQREHSLIMAEMAKAIDPKQDITDKFSSSYLKDRYREVLELRRDGAKAMRIDAKGIGL